MKQNFDRLESFKPNRSRGTCRNAINDNAQNASLNKFVYLKNISTMNQKEPKNKLTPAHTSALHEAPSRYQAFGKITTNMKHW